VQAQSVTDALSAFEELAPADVSDDATSDEDEEYRSSLSLHSAQENASHLEVGTV